MFTSHWNAITYKRKAWIYIPGTRRVRRAPTVGYDTPDGPGGLLTVDDNVGFNGAMDRYDWKLIGKKEVYIPYHNYKFDHDGNRLQRAAAKISCQSRLYAL